MSEIDEKKKQNNGKGCVLLVVIAIAVFFSIKWYLTGEDMNIETNYTGTQIVFTNLDDKFYKDVVVTINDSYTVKIGDFLPYDTYTVGIMQFADEKGNRFNLSMKPLKIKYEGKDAEYNF